LFVQRSAALEEWTPANLPCSPNSTSQTGCREQKGKKKIAYVGNTWAGRTSRPGAHVCSSPARPSKDLEAASGGALGQAVVSTRAPQSPFTLPVGQKPVFQDGRQTRVGVAQFGPRVRGLKAAGADVSADKGLETSLTGTQRGGGAGLTRQAVGFTLWPQTI